MPRFRIHGPVPLEGLAHVGQVWRLELLLVALGLQPLVDLDGRRAISGLFVNEGKLGGGQMGRHGERACNPTIEAASLDPHRARHVLSGACEQKRSSTSTCAAPPLTPRPRIQC